MQTEASTLADYRYSIYIFGEPNQTSGITKDNLLQDIENFCKRVVEIRESIDKELRETIPSYYYAIEYCRQLRKAYNPIHIYRKRYEQYKGILSNIDKHKETQKIINKNLNKLRDTLLTENYIDDGFIYDDQQYYIIKSGLSSINIKKHIIDFKIPNHKRSETLDKIIYWYTRIDENRILHSEQWSLTPAEETYIDSLASADRTTENSIDYNSIIYKTMGELGIYGCIIGEIPAILKQYIASIASINWERLI